MTAAKKWVSAAAVLLAAVLAAGACGGSGTDEAATGGQDEAVRETTAAAGSTATGREAPNLSIKTLDGEEFNLKDKRGEVVALYFMAGWCGSCIPEARAWSELYPEYRDKGLELLVVSADPNDTPQTIERFRRAGGIRELPWAIDETGGFTRSLGVRALDSTIVFGKDGEVVYRDAVPTGRQTLEQEIEEAL
ncbi:Thiol-disulfide oxidoreductase ResA [Rubrobacter xylanophilus DSM 9941]|uniref:peroxiredoxin family protein n=1 Tax=Rubrobacter xylanophilus TaxID=49319 RepID=UPI001C63B8D9|nr:redoxin domain-containing protein [Rubrobacter xylanophilus]QYJ15047.1 Thiol-disulfide oxidoreductase ResA [Rubrobacter xylanophilus DSM 9941]